MRICDFIKTINTKAKIINDVEANYYEFEKHRTYFGNNNKIYYIFDEKYICIFEVLLFRYSIKDFCRIEELENHLLSNSCKDFPIYGFVVSFIDNKNNEYLLRFYRATTMVKEVCISKCTNIFSFSELHNPYGYAKLIFRGNILKEAVYYLNGKIVDDFQFEIAKAVNKSFSV